jgi:hypothetical protein
MEREIREYIRKQKSPQREILSEVRQIFLRTIPDCSERRAWGVIAFAGDKFYLAAMKDRVHVGFSIKGLSLEEISLFEGNGKTMRHIKIARKEDIDEKKLCELISLVQKKAFCDPC